MAKHLWQKGQSGNPKGREPLDAPIREALMAHVPTAAKRIVELMRCDDEPAVALRAAQYVIDRVYGKPATALTIEMDPNALPFYQVIAPKEIPFDEWQKKYLPPPANK